MTALLAMATMALLLLPGYTLWALAHPAPLPSLSHRITGLSFAAAVGVCAAYAITFAGLDLFLWAWGAACLASVAAWIFRLRGSSIQRPPLDAAAVALLALLTAVLLLRLLPTFFHDYPRGWDPYFHLLLARKILRAGAHIHDWLPYEEIPLTYPTGSHLLLAAMARVTGAPLHGLFKVALALFGVLTVAQVFALVRAATPSRRAALLAAACYALLPIYGSIGYYRWGGLPNLMGVYLLLGALTVLTASPRRRLPLLLPPFFVGLCLLNHHVLASAVLLFLIMLPALAAMPAHRPRAGALLAAAAISLLPGALYFYPRLTAGFPLTETGLLQYSEPVHTVGAILSKVGYGYTLLALAGAALLRLGRRGWLGARTAAVHPALLLGGGALLLYFVLFEYAGRALGSAWLGRPIAPFTPSRFLTDAIPLLAVFPGLLLHRLLPRGARGAALAAGLLLLLGLENASLQRGYLAPVVRPDQAAAYRWIRANTAPNTVVLDRYIHAAYIADRVASNTPIPTSELWARATKRRKMEAVLSGAAAPSSLGAPVVLVSGAARGKLLWSSPDGKLHVAQVHQPASP